LQAGGQIGGYLVQNLLKNPKQTITALTRKDSPSKIPDGVKTAVIDYDDESTIVAALKGQDCLIISLSITAAPDTHAKLCKAAATAGVAWVMPNEWGVNVSDTVATETVVLAGKAKERQYIESLGISWVGLSCGFWYEYSLAGSVNRYGFDLRNREAVFFDDGTVHLCTSTFEQVGRAVAAVMALKILPDNEADKDAMCLDRFRSNHVHVSSFRVSQRDMFASLLRVTGTKESDWKISSEPAKERWEAAKRAFQAGDRMALARVLYTRMFMKDAPSDFEDRLENKALGLPEEDLDKSTAVTVQWDKEGKFDRGY
jgi:NmrA-like family